MTDGKVSLKGMKFYAQHGVYKEERMVGNKYSVDVTLVANIAAAAKSDRLEDTINYELVYALVRKVMDSNVHLLECLAKKIINLLKSKFPQLKTVKVKISKHNPPVKGLCKRATVTLNG